MRAIVFAWLLITLLASCTKVCPLVYPYYPSGPAVCEGAGSYDDE